jgi:hypothetical protein
MTTKFKVKLNGHGNHSDALLKIIGNHNAGLAKVNLEDLAGYVKSRVCEYPTLFSDVVSPDVDEHTLNISSKEGELPYLTIQECIYEGLIENPVLDQYTKENLSQAGSQC